MEQHRSLHRPGPTEDTGQLTHLVPVYGTDVCKAHILKKAAGQQIALDRLFDAVVEFIDRLAAWDFIRGMAVHRFQREIRGPEMVAGQKGCDAAHIFLNGHAVVI